MAATIKEIARKTNLSIATVSRALSGDPKVQPATRELVLRVADELNYRPNLLARNFVMGKSNLIGLILPDISDEFFSEIIKGVDKTCFDSGYYTLVISYHENRSITESIKRLTGSGILGGLIFLLPYFTEEIKKEISDEQIPISIISGFEDIGNYNVVSIDNYRAAFEMTEFLIGKGYKKIAHITGPLDNYDSLLRLKGFKDACQKNNLPLNNDWILNGGFTKSGGRQAALRLTEKEPKPEVIFAANDMMAVGCYEVFKERGIAIPDDIGVVGFDDILLASHLTPPLTTVKVHIEEVGRKAVELLLKSIESANSKQKIKVGAELVIRNSC